MNDDDWDEPAATAALDSASRTAWRISQLDGFGSKPIGLPALDRQLDRIGQGCRDSGEAVQPAPNTTVAAVFLVTEVYLGGGHTPLVGDFVRALRAIDGDDGSGDAFRVIATAYHHPERVFEDPALAARMGVRPEQLVRLDPAPSGAKLRQLCRLLDGLQPRRLFLFHHPFDPLGPAAAGCCQDLPVHLVHHGDSSPCLGLHSSGVRLLHPTPTAAAFAGLLGLETTWLPLTVDPPEGVREAPAAAGEWRTCSSGRAEKFPIEANGLPSFEEVVKTLLEHGCERHIHIGPMDEDRVRSIRQYLQLGGIDPARFELIDWVPSLATALLEHRVDWYLDSWPQDGARSRIESMAAGVPVLNHVRTRMADPETSGPTCETGLGWHRPEDLAGLLDKAAGDPALWSGCSSSQGEIYRNRHHPSAFRSLLGRILDGGTGARIPLPVTAGSRIERSLIKALAKGFSDEVTNKHRLDEIGRLKQQLAGQRRVTERLAARLGQLEAAGRGKLWKGVRRWFRKR